MSANFTFYLSIGIVTNASVKLFINTPWPNPTRPQKCPEVLHHVKHSVSDVILWRFRFLIPHLVPRCVPSANRQPEHWPLGTTGSITCHDRDL